jgi:hypothetical protein
MRFRRIGQLCRAAAKVKHDIRFGADAAASAALLSARQPSVDAGNSEEAICDVPAVPIRVQVR